MAPGRILAAPLAALLALVAPAGTALAEPVTLRLTLLQDGRPMAGAPVRVAVGSDAEVSAPAAGARVTTGADGRVTHRTEATPAPRTITSTSIFARHRAEHLVVGVELDLLGRPALYKVRLDQVAAGAVGQMVVHLKGRGGAFDLPLIFHSREHSWSLPDDPAGLRLSGIGAELKAFSMDGSAATGRTIEITIDKQEFQRR